MTGSAWAFSAHAGRCILRAGSRIPKKYYIIFHREGEVWRGRDHAGLGVIGGWRMTGSAETRRVALDVAS